MPGRRLVPFVAALASVLGLLAAGSSGSERSVVAAPAAPSSTTATSTATTSAEASPGCAAAAPAPGRTEVTVMSGDRERRYIQYVPPGLAPGAPAPLVVDFTAYSPASLEESFSGFTTPDAAGRILADDEGAVVITPEPVNGAGALLTWNYVGTPGYTDDQAFVADLMDQVEATACIDTARVLAMGFAVGGVFASITACGQADRFAALVTVAGLYSPEDCAPSKPLPVLSFHGTGDRFIPFDGGAGEGAGGLGLSPETIAGLVFMASRPGALDSSAAWADHGGCEVEPDDDPVAAGVTRLLWSDCAQDTSVELYVIDGGEHTWPGSNGMAAFENLLGPVSNAVNANDVIWDFFVDHTG